MIKQIDHLGIAVRNLDESIEYYENVLGFHCHRRETVAGQQVSTALFKVGEVQLELLQPTSDESPIAKFLEKNGEGIHHVAFAVDDIAGQLKKAMKAEVRVIHSVPFEGADHKWVAFLHPNSTHGVLTEFCQDQ